LEGLGLGVKTDHRIRFHPGFAVPQDIFDDNNPVRLRPGPPWRGPLAGLAGRRIKPLQLATGIVRVPEHIAAGDGDSTLGRNLMEGSTDSRAPLTYF
jgi:hypothetical protein